MWLLKTTEVFFLGEICMGSFKNLRPFIVSITIVAVLSGCSLSRQTEYGAIGGVAGGAVGAGTGAAIGGAIANGDIAGSALLGTAIGVPVGIAVGVIYANSLETAKLDENENIIRSNAEEISRTQKRLEIERDIMREETSGIEPNKGVREYRYEGASLGNSFR